MAAAGCLRYSAAEGRQFRLALLVALLRRLVFAIIALQAHVCSSFSRDENVLQRQHYALSADHGLLLLQLKNQVVKDNQLLLKGSY